MRVNATKGITTNQPLIAGCRPLMLGRQAADLNLVWLDESSRGSCYSSSQHAPHWRVRPKQHLRAQIFSLPSSVHSERRNDPADLLNR